MCKLQAPSNCKLPWMLDGFKKRSPLKSSSFQLCDLSNPPDSGSDSGLHLDIYKMIYIDLHIYLHFWICWYSILWMNTTSVVGNIVYILAKYYGKSIRCGKYRTDRPASSAHKTQVSQQERKEGKIKYTILQSLHCVIF